MKLSEKYDEFAGKTFVFKRLKLIFFFRFIFMESGFYLWSCGSTKNRYEHSYVHPFVIAIFLVCENGLVFLWDASYIISTDKRINLIILMISLCLLKPEKEINNKLWMVC